MTSLMDRRPRALLVVLCLLLWMPGFFTIPAGDRDESRFTQATKQMLETGDFVRIMNGTEARNRKPIGIHWLQAPFVAVAHGLGVATENPVWPYRVPSALGGLVAVLACFGLGERMFGRRLALLGAGLLAASVLVVTEVHIAKTDAALLGATTVVMAVLGRAYLEQRRLGWRVAAAFWLAMGVGVLLKGPITPMIVGLAGGTLWVLDRRAGRAGFLGRLHAGWGVPLMLAVVLPWFVAIGVATEGRFFADAVGGDLGRKLTSGDDAHGGPPGLHLLLLPLLVFPGAAALPSGVLMAWRGRAAAPVRFLLAWIVPGWLVFEAAPTKLPHYTLPLYPAVCLLLAWGLSEAAGRWRWAGAGLGAVVTAVLVAVGVGGPVFLGLSPWLGAPAAMGALMVGWFAVRAFRVRELVWGVVLSPLLYGAVLGWELPRLWPLWIGPRVMAAAPAAGWGRLGSAGYSEPSLMFLAGSGTRWLLADEGAAALADGTIDTLLVGDRDLAAVRAALSARGLEAHVAAEVPGFNYSRGRKVVLSALTR